MKKRGQRDAEEVGREGRKAADWSGKAWYQAEGGTGRGLVFVKGG